MVRRGGVTLTPVVQTSLEALVTLGPVMSIINFLCIVGLTCVTPMLKIRVDGCNRATI